MASFIQKFFADWNSMSKKNEEYAKKISNLESKIDSLEIGTEKKNQLIEELHEAQKSSNYAPVELSNILNTQSFINDHKFKLERGVCSQCGNTFLGYSFDGRCDSCRATNFDFNTVSVFSNSLGLSSDLSGLCPFCLKPKISITGESTCTCNM